MHPFQKRSVSGQHRGPAAGRAIQARDLIRNADNLLPVRVELAALNLPFVRGREAARGWGRLGGLLRRGAAGVVHDEAVCSLDDARRTAEIRRKLHHVAGEILHQLA